MLTLNLRTLIAAVVVLAAIAAFAIFQSSGEAGAATSGPLPSATPGPHSSDPPGYTFSAARP